MAKIKKCENCGRMTDLTISWSSLRAHTECKQKGFLQRSGKKAIMLEHRAFFAGTVTDRVTRDWLMMDDPQPGIMPSMVEEMVAREEEKILKKGQKLTWKDPEDKQRLIDECKVAVKEIEPHLQKYVLPYDYQPDASFKAPIRAKHPETGQEYTINLIGFMDILVHDPVTDRWFVYDVKHTKNEAYWKKTRGQLSFYDLAVNLMEGSYTSFVGLLQPLCKEQVKGFILTEDDRTILLKHILDMANDIWKNNVEPTAPISECYSCNVKHACTRFKPVNNASGKRRMSLLTGEEKNDGN